VVWSRDGITSHDDSWFLKHSMDMQNQTGAHLALDYVATRDILEGEELFLDYGDEWEEVWQEHTTNWESRNVWSDTYMTARAWNEVMGDTPIRTDVEASCDPYPANLQIRCHIDLDEDDWRYIAHWVTWNYGYPCQILDRKRNEKGKYSYKVRMTTVSHDQYDFEFEGPEILVIDEVPRSAIRFFDVPHTTDLLLHGAFRHHIGLPDELIQDAWRNLPKEKADCEKSEDEL
jgi:hypothetical protein